MLVVAEAPGLDADRDSDLADRLGLTDGTALGCRLHLSGPLDGGGRRLVTLWDSREQFEAWRDDRLAAVLHAAAKPVPTMHVWEVDGS